MFLVIAYRWGWTNAHHYHVYAGPDETKARALATAEAHDRGGKYGCAVLRFDADGTDSERIAYEPSTYGETAPHHNHRIDMFQSLGHSLHHLAHGRRYAREGNRLIPQAVEPPEWVVAEVEFREERARQMAEFAKAAHERQPAEAA